MMQRSLVSILLSLTGITILLKINMNIADVYEMSGPKTRALFGLVELGFLYKYYAGVFGLLAIILSIFARQKGEKKSWTMVALVLSIIAFLATFIKLWRGMV